MYYLVIRRRLVKNHPACVGKAMHAHIIIMEKTVGGLLLVINIGNFGKILKYLYFFGKILLYLGIFGQILVWDLYIFMYFYRKILSYFLVLFLNKFSH